VTITRQTPAFAHVPPDIIVLMPHMFVFYFACVSAITPPVALAAYAGAGISGSDPMRTGVMSFRLGIASYIVPYMFFYAPEILLIGTVPMILLRTATALIGILGLASAAQGYFRRHLNLFQRLVMLAASISLVSPNEFADIIGIGLMVLVYFSHNLPYFRKQQYLLEEKVMESAS
jgi:TRAP-type uncharacterized transport system fused permease subunit